MKIFLAADHRGFELKEHLKSYLQAQNHEVVDCGNDHLDPQDDYVDFTARAAQELLHELPSDNGALAVAICGSGIGVSIAANRFAGIRCALCISPEHAEHARRNDHANTLALPSELVTQEVAETILQAFMTTPPSLEDKYVRRTKKLDALA